MTKLIHKESGHKKVTTKDLNNILESIQRQTLLRANYNTHDQNIESSLYLDDENNHSIHTTTRPSQLLSTSSLSSSSSSITKYEYWLNQMGLSPHVIQYLIQSKRNNINDRTTQGLNTLNNQVTADDDNNTTNNHLKTTHSPTWPNLRHIFPITHNPSRHSTCISTPQPLIGPHTPLYQHDHIANYPHIYTNTDTDIQKDLLVAIHPNTLHDDFTTRTDNTNNKNHENNTTMGVHTYEYGNHHELYKSQLSPYIIDEYISQLKQGQLSYKPYNQYNSHPCDINIHRNTDMMSNNNTDVHNITRNSTASVTVITQNQQITPSHIENDYLHVQIDPSVSPSPYISHTIPLQPYAVYENPYRSVPIAIKRLLEPYIMLDRYTESNKVTKSSSSILMLPTCKSRKKRKIDEINTQDIQLSPSSSSSSASYSTSSSSSSTSILHNQVNSEDNKKAYTAHDSNPSLPLPFRRELLLGAIGRHSEGLADTLLQWLFDSTEALLKKEGHLTKNTKTKRYITWKDVLQMLHQTYSHHSINPYVYEVPNLSDDLKSTIESPSYKKRRLFQVHPRLPYMRLNDTIMTRIQNRLRGLFESAEVPALQRTPITHHHTMSTRTVQSTSLDRYTHTLSSPSTERNINISEEQSVESVLVHPRSQQTRLPTLPRRYSSISKKSSRYFLKKLYKSYQPYTINLNRVQEYQWSDGSIDTQKKHLRDIHVPACTSDSGVLDVVNSIKTTPVSTSVPHTSSSSMHSLSKSTAIFQPYSKIHIYYKRLPSTTTNNKARYIKRIRQKRKKYF